MLLNALFLPLLSGLFFLVGFLIVRFFKNNNGLTIFATGMSFCVMLGMILFDLIPEIIEHFLEFNSSLFLALMLIFIFFGILILKIFDIFLPHHHHEHHEKENLQEHNHHLDHIGYILGLSLILHNIVEGSSLYVIALENLKTGFLLSIGIGLHNTPLGIEIASHFKNNEVNSFIKFLLFIFLIFSGLLGALILFLFNEISSFVTFALICVATGMILYIIIFELFSEIRNYVKEKVLYLGMFTGIFLLIIMTFFK